MHSIKEFKGREYPDLISVIIPLYKSFDHEKIRISIDSLRQQQKVNLEIVIAEQSSIPTFDRVQGISYTFVHEELEQPAIPGRIRNAAAKFCSGTYIYNSDGDIIYTNPYYFAEILELIKTGQDIALYRPPMRRLPLEEFDFFREKWQELGLQEALRSLDTSQEFTARKPGSKIVILPFRKKESGRLKTFLYSSTDYERYSSDPQLKGSEPKYSTLNVHAGGTFMETKHFREVGGFCETFAAWGCHDADLQWKLKNIVNLFEFPNFPEYEVLHIDHNRGYFDREKWQENRKVQQFRRSMGAAWAIAKDLENG